MGVRALPGREGAGLFCGGGDYVEKRIGVVGIVVDDKENILTVNQILSQYGDIIVGRMGIPHRERDIAVISLIVDGSTDKIGALTGQLGKVPGIRVRSALSRE